MQTKLSVVTAVLAGALTCTAFTSSQASTVTYDYNVNLTLGSWTVTGDIQTDATGTLSAGDITGFSLQLSNGVNSYTLSSISALGSDLSADANGLFYNFGSSANGYLDFYQPSAAFFELAQPNYCGTSQAVCVGAPSIVFASSSMTGAFEIGTAATPLPAALPLFATGLGGLGLLGWRRKRKAQALV